MWLCWSYNDLHFPRKNFFVLFFYFSDLGVYRLWASMVVLFYYIYYFLSCDKKKLHLLNLLTVLIKKAFEWWSNEHGSCARQCIRGNSGGRILIPHAHAITASHGAFVSLTMRPFNCDLLRAPLQHRESYLRK